MGNQPVQFIQGNSISELTEAMCPGSIYFFKDGSIVWDHQDDENSSAERTIMNGQVLEYTIHGFALNNQEWKNQPCSILNQCPNGTYIIQLALITANEDNGTNLLDTKGIASGVCSLQHGVFEGSRSEEIQLHYAAEKNSNARLYAAINYNNDSSISLGLSTNVSYLGVGALQIKLQKIY